MAQRPGSHRADHASPLVDLDVVFADDRLIDSIAGADPVSAAPVEYAVGRGRHSAGRQPAGPFGRGPHALHSQHAGRPATGIADPPAIADPLTELFQTWRHELASEPLPPVPSVYRAAEPVVTGSEQRKRSLRPALSIAAAIAALLFGSATIGSKDADQDSALWGITQVLWPDRAVSVASRDHVRQALDEASGALAAGDAQEAQLALLRAAVELGKVADVDGKGGMQQQVDALWREAAPRELSGTSLTAEAMTEQMLADGPAAGVTPSVAQSSTSAAARSVLTTSVASPVVPSTAAGAGLEGKAKSGTVVPRPTRQQTVTLAPRAVEGSAPTVADPASSPTGAVSSPGTVVASPITRASASPVNPPPIALPPVDPSAPVTSPAPAAPATPTPPVAVEPPPAEVHVASRPPVSSTRGTTAPASAPAPTGTGTGQTADTQAATTATATTAPATTTPAGWRDRHPHPRKRVWPAG